MKTWSILIANHFLKFSSSYRCNLLYTTLFVLVVFVMPIIVRYYWKAIEYIYCIFKMKLNRISAITRSCNFLILLVIDSFQINHATTCSCSLIGSICQKRCEGGWVRDFGLKCIQWKCSLVVTVSADENSSKVTGTIHGRTPSHIPHTGLTFEPNT